MVTSYPVLFLLCATSGIIPIPEDIPVLYAGIAARTGTLSPLGVLIVAVSGVFVRDGMFYAAGRYLGPAILTQRHVSRWLGADRIVRARDALKTHGAAAVLLGRFLIGFRTPVFLTAGAVGISPSRFFLWDGIGLLVMIPLMFGLGYLIGERAIHWVSWAAGKAPWLVGAALVLLVLWGIRGVMKGGSTLSGTDESPRP